MSYSGITIGFRPYFAAYNEGTYSSSIYGDTSSTEPTPDSRPQTETTQDTTILAPLTGFVRDQPPYILAGIGLFIVVLLYLSIRFITAKRRKHHSL